MDLLFQRYGSPMQLLEEYIALHNLSGFITEIIEITNEEEEMRTLWEYFLHKVEQLSWSEFYERSCTSKSADQNIDFEATVENSRNILNNFSPEEEEVKHA